jgi:hypothetical protein
LRKENYELRRANGILKSASVSCLRVAANVDRSGGHPDRTNARERALEHGEGLVLGRVRPGSGLLAGPASRLPHDHAGRIDVGEMGECGGGGRLVAKRDAGRDHIDLRAADPDIEDRSPRRRRLVAPSKTRGCLPGDAGPVPTERSSHALNTCERRRCPRIESQRTKRVRRPYPGEDMRFDTLLAATVAPSAAAAKRWVAGNARSGNSPHRRRCRHHRCS